MHVHVYYNPLLFIYNILGLNKSVIYLKSLFFYLNKETKDACLRTYSFIYKTD